MRTQQQWNFHLDKSIVELQEQFDIQKHKYNKKILRLQHTIYLLCWLLAGALACIYILTK